MTRLPELTQPAPNDTQLRQQDKTQKLKIKNNADKKRGSRHRQIKVGDKVSRQEQFSMCSYAVQYATVWSDSCEGYYDNRISSDHGQHGITRNISHFKRYHGETTQADDSSDTDSADENAEDPEDVILPAHQPALATPPARRNPRRDRRLPVKLNDYIVP